MKFITTHNFKTNDGLDCLYIQYPKTQAAQVKLVLPAGSEFDPEDFMGLAHMLEHAVFLNSDLDTYLAKYNGDANAQTADDFTLFEFDCHVDGLAGGLTRLLDHIFFPKFTHEDVVKERDVVNSEFESAYAQDDWQQTHLIYHHLVNQQHPVSRFSFGNNKTLADKDGKSLDEALREHHKEFYHTDGAKLIICSNHDVADVKLMLNQQLPTGTKKLRDTRPLYSSEHVGIVKTEAESGLRITFYCPLSTTNKQQLSALATLYALSCPGTLFHKYKDSILGSEVDTQVLTPSQAELIVSFDLESEFDPQEIISGFFSYTKFLGSTNLSDYAKMLSDHQKINYEHEDFSPAELVEYAADNCLDYPLGEILETIKWPVFDFSELLVQIKPEAVRVLIALEDFESNLKVPITGKTYSIEPVGEIKIDNGFSIPQKWSLPSDFNHGELVQYKDALPTDEYADKLRFSLITKIDLTVSQRKTLHHALLLSLEEFTDEMGFAGFALELCTHPLGMIFTFSGFPSNFMHFVNLILELFKQELPIKRALAIIDDSIKEGPSIDVEDRLNFLVKRLIQAQTVEPDLNEYRISPDLLSSVQANLFSNVAQHLFVGVVDDNIYNELKAVFPIQKTTFPALPSPNKSGALASSASGIVLARVFEDTPSNHAMLLLVEALLKEPFFKSLRTDSNFGYHASLSAGSYDHRPTLTLLLHVNSHDLLGAYDAIVEFINTSFDYSQFEFVKGKILSSLLAPACTLSDLEDEAYDTFFMLTDEHSLQNKIAALKQISQHETEQFILRLAKLDEWIKGSAYPT